VWCEKPNSEGGNRPNFSGPLDRIITGIMRFFGLDLKKALGNTEKLPLANSPTMIVRGEVRMR
jgi:hypothetical protein